MNKPTIVVDAKTRYQFMMAASEAGMADKAYRIATRLALHFNIRTGLCNPGTDLLMQKLGISESTLMRGLRELKADGWITSKRGGSTQNAEFTLSIPTSITVIQVTAMNDDPYLSDLASIAVKNGLHSCHHADSTKNSGTGKQDSAAPPRAVSPVEAPVSSKPVARESAAVAALDCSSILHDARQRFTLSSSQAEPLCIALKNTTMSKDFVVSHLYASPNCEDFLAAIASDRFSVSMNSSH